MHACMNRIYPYTYTHETHTNTTSRTTTHTHTYTHHTRTHTTHTLTPTLIFLSGTVKITSPLVCTWTQTLYYAFAETNGRFSWEVHAFCHAKILFHGSRSKTGRKKSRKCCGQYGEMNEMVCSACACIYVLHVLHNILHMVHFHACTRCICMMHIYM